MSNRPLSHILEDNEGLAYECARLDREYKELRQQYEQAQARVAELEDLAVEAAQLFNAIKDGEYTVDSFTAQPYERVQRFLSSQPWLLRKKAEAVESFLSQQAPLLDRYRPQPINEEDHCCEFNLLRDRERLHSEAQRLRQQADDIEKEDSGNAG